MTFSLTGIPSAPQKLMALACSSITSTDSVLMEPFIIPSLQRRLCKRGSVSPSCWSLYKGSTHEFGRTFSFTRPPGKANDRLTHVALQRWAVDILGFWMTQREQDHQERLQQNGELKDNSRSGGTSTCCPLSWFQPHKINWPSHSCKTALSG